VQIRQLGAQTSRSLRLLQLLVAAALLSKQRAQVDNQLLANKRSLALESQLEREDFEIDVRYCV
jgi:hypothetical protein